MSAALNTDSPRGAATATVRTRDGRVLETTVLHPIGSLERPLSDADIEAKTRDLAMQGEFGGSIDAVIQAVWGIDRMATVAPLMAAAGRP